MVNWKTTLAGAITAVGMYLSQTTDPTLKAVGGIVAAIGAFLTGIFAKDYNVTGGSKEQ